MSKLIFWGTGIIAKRAINYFKESKDFVEDEILVFVDNDTSKVGTVFEEINVVSPKEIHMYFFDYLVICCRCLNDVIKQIKDSSICDYDKIWSFEEYTQYLYSKKAYYKKYGTVHKSVDYRLNLKSKLTVYTSIIGDYDDLKDPEYLSDNIEYICFTNNRKIQSKVWDVRYIDNKEESNVHMARKIKILPHMFMDIKGKVVWVDAKCIIKQSLLDYIENYQKSSNILCFPHFGRDCIVDEAAVLTGIRPDQKKESFIQVAKYLQEGMPLNYGLYETACLVRDMSDPAVRDLMEQWWYEVSHYSYRDQISLPYIFWKNNYEPDICDQNITNNKWIRFEKHK